VLCKATLTLHKFLVGGRNFMLEVLVLFRRCMLCLGIAGWLLCLGMKLWFTAINIM